jgi:hypothetical protein
MRTGRILSASGPLQPVNGLHAVAAGNQRGGTLWLPRAPSPELHVGLRGRALPRWRRVRTLRRAASGTSVAESPVRRAVSARRRNFK